jgi:hypothetical protein
VPTFLGVQRVVEADADDLARRVDRQRRLDGIEGEFGGGGSLGRGGLDGGERAAPAASGS